jgi:hypothetical protein
MISLPLLDPPKTLQMLKHSGERASRRADVIMDVSGRDVSPNPLSTAARR